MRGSLRKSAAVCSTLCKLQGRLATDASFTATERAVASNYFYQGKFSLCEQCARAGDIPQTDASQGLDEAYLDLNAPRLSCRGYRALSQWFLGDSAQARLLCVDAKQDALALGHGHTTAIVHLIVAMVAHFEQDVQGVRVAASELHELSCQKGYFLWRIAAQLFTCWADSREVEGGHQYVDTMRELKSDWVRNEARLFLPYWSGLAAEAALTAQQPSRAVEEVRSGLLAANRNGEHWWTAELHRLLAVSCALLNSGDRDVRRQLETSSSMARTQGALALSQRTARTAALLGQQPSTVPAGRLCLRLLESSP